ncbi:hypothetical protein EVAR_64731_1 [Eumeta japonica]|uniref:Uncharacterized protein n=1 Tax=Eumeta variegata TaxID=151549 RepID=A0A4C1Z7W2_EUMVA|nr:hypothetical protein EVAR_64731_1 [Eumeta japonica]
MDDFYRRACGGNRLSDNREVVIRERARVSADEAPADVSTRAGRSRTIVYGYSSTRSRMSSASFELSLSFRLRLLCLIFYENLYSAPMLPFYDTRKRLYE